jgi:ABC-type Zn uptake system ZnuABC Zn-binding protein ZnuA
MSKHLMHLQSAAAAVLLLLSACQPAAQAAPGKPKVLAVENFLADMALNVAGDRIQVDALIPVGVEPHEYEPTPQDVAKISNCSVLIVNGAGLESWLDKTLSNAGGQRTVVTASQGLTTRKPRPGEPEAAAASDPHFWMDPNLAVSYVENIRAGLTLADPAGADVYKQNAAAYEAKLRDMDTWIRGQVASVPANRRLLVTNHESLGYYADRYGFQIVGTLIPSVSTDASPSAQQVVQVVQAIRAAGAPAIFLETGVNPQLAQQVAAEAGVKIVTGLYTHFTTAANGPAPTYLDMLRVDTNAIVSALK